MTLDVLNKKFGRLTVLSFHGYKHENRSRFYLCRCDCGKEKVVCSSNLVSGRTQSCGCLQKERCIETHTTHGESGNVGEYSIWKGIIARCFREGATSYKNYGARGITVDSRWLGENGYKTFLADMGRKPTKNHTIERKDNNGNYCKENCYWLIAELQQKNTRRNHWIEMDGKKMIMSDWAKELGLSVKTIFSRFNYGWSVEKTLKTPLRKLSKSA